MSTYHQCLYKKMMKTKDQRDVVTTFRALLRQAEKGSSLGLCLCLSVIEKDGGISYKPLVAGFPSRSKNTAIAVSAQFALYLMTKYFYSGMLGSRWKPEPIIGCTPYPGEHTVNVGETAEALSALIELSKRCEMAGFVYIYFKPDGSPITGKSGRARRDSEHAFTLASKLFFALANEGIAGMIFRERIFKNQQ